MPAWKGWNEETVRRLPNDLPNPPPRQNALFTGAIGFTAINAPPPSGRARIVDSEASSDDSSAAAWSERADPASAMSHVSEYLGHGDNNSTEAPVKQAIGPLHGPGTRKSIRKGKKRAANSKAQPQAKRRKKSDVSDGMPVAKGVNQCIANKTVTQLDEQSQNPYMITSVGETRFSDRSTADAPNRFISIFAPPTSMISLQTASQPTSVESLQPSAAHSSTTLYKRQTECGTSVGQELNSRADAGNFQASLPFGVKCSDSTPRAQRVVEDTLRSSPATAREAAGNSPLLRIAPRPTDGKRNEQTGNAGALPSYERVSESDPSRNDYLTADDDEMLSEILDLVDRAEAEASREPDPRTPKSSVVTNIDASKRRPTLFLTPDEEFVLLADSDEDKIAECWMAEESAAIQRSPTPPYRDRKLNLRDVDPHEDYGGALLSDADQRLLGMAKIIDRTLLVLS